MKAKKFYKALFLLAMPIFLQEFINASVNLLDQIMVGTLGLDSINGVAFAGQILFVCMLVMFGVNSGSSIFMGQFWGKRDVASIRKVMGICYITNICISFVFAFGAIVVPEALIRIYSAESEVIRLGAMYLRIVGPSFLLSAVTTTTNASLRSIGQTKIPMFTTLIALVSNGALNALFIFGLGWGVAGAAIATLTARVLEITVQQIVIRKLHLPVAAPLRGYLTADAAFIKSFFTITMPVILNEGMWGLGTSLYQVVFKACGNESQGAVQIGSSVLNVFIVIGMGIGSACGIMLANQLGAGEREDAIVNSRRSLLLACGLSACMGGLLILLSPVILSFYDVSPDIKATAQLIMYIIAVALVLKTYNYTTIVGILRSGGDTKYCLIVDVLSVWAIGLPMAALGAYFLHLPIHIVMIMMYSEEVFKFIITSFRVRSNKWATQLV